MAWQRPLTGAEQWQWLFDRAAVFNLVYVARVAGRFDEDRLRTALAVIAGHYPHLTARIEPGKPPHFVAADESISIPLQVIPWNEGSWRSVVEDEVNTPHDTETGPLARAVLLNGFETSELVLTVSHAVADGQSGALIVNKLLELHGGGPLPALPQPDVLEPPITALLGSRMKAFGAAVQQLRMSRRMTPIPPADWVPARERRTGLIDVQFDAAAVILLGREARAHGATVHGALAAAMLLAIDKELRTLDAADGHTLGCVTPVDLRRHAGLTHDAVGNLLSGVVSSHRVSGDSPFWRLAAEVSQTIRSAIAGGELFTVARLQDMTATEVNDFDSMVATAERFNRAAAVVTNLGDLDYFPRYGDLRLESLGFLVSNNANAAAALVLCATTAAATTCLNFTYAEPLLPKDRAQRLVDDAIERLSAAIR